MPRRENQISPSTFSVVDHDCWGRRTGDFWVREDWQKLDHNHVKEDVDDWHGPYRTSREARNAAARMELDRGRCAKP